MVYQTQSWGPTVVLLICLLTASGAASARSDLQFKLLGVHHTGVYDEGAAEISAYDPTTHRLFVVNADAATIDIVDISKPSDPRLFKSIGVSDYGAGVNSVAVGNGIVAVAVEAERVQDPGRVVFFDADGAVLNSVQVGVLPDMLTFSPDGTRVLVANEGQPGPDYAIDPEGSVSIIDLSGGPGAASVTHVTFASFNGQESRLRSQGVRIFGPGANAAQDLEPEYIAVAPDGSTAYVALQENNALAVVDVAAASVSAIIPLGFKDHGTPDNALDASNRDDGIRIREWPVFGMYQPDAIASFESEGQTFVISANEGDSRDYNGFSEEARVADLTLDAAAFPNAASLQDDAHLGRLKTTTSLGDTDGDGDHDRLYAYGGRSFSIWDRRGNLVFDSGDDFERRLADLVPEDFNADNDENGSFDSRSDDKGPEPEAVVTGTIDNRVYAFIGLERVGGVMVYDISLPSAPSFVTYVNNRDFSVRFGPDDVSRGDLVRTGDLGPEGLIFIPAADSPTGEHLLVVSNEVSGSVSIFQIVTPATPAGEFTLTILHNNDGESQLINAGEGLEDFGGVDRFKALVDRLKSEARMDGGVIMVSSGDNFLAGPEFNVSLRRPESAPFYDALAMDLIGYDAVCIGNHDFDFGPDLLARFISGYSLTRPPYLSANLDFGDEPKLADLVASGRISGSRIVRVDGEHIGIVGATTPDLAFISSPRNVRVDGRLREAIQAEVNGLALRGVNTVVLISHLQSINNDLELARQLRGVDVVIAGGGDDILANPGTRLIPGDEAGISGPYPILEKDADGNDVRVVTTAGNYRYVGRFVARFNDAGVITSVDRNASGPVRVAGGDQPDAVAPDAEVRNRVVAPVIDALASLVSNPVGTSSVVLDGVKRSIRTRETNEGNLVADALRWQSAQLASSFGVPVPQVGIVNGGGIRNAGEIPAGVISELTTFDMLPFPNFVTIVPAVPAAQFREIMENAVSKVEDASGRFAQISGFTMVWNPDGVAQELDESGNVTRRGGRIVDITLDTGAGIVENGNVVSGAPDVHVATVDFLARGGDQYPFRGARFTGLGVTYQQALVNFIGEALDGRITAAAYPAGGQGRITTGQPAPADRPNVHSRSVVHVFLTGDGGPVPDARVEFSRSISGRARNYRWMGTTDAEGRTTIEIQPESRRSVSGYYAVRAVDIKGSTFSKWESVPINSGREITLLLPVGGVARVEEERPLAAKALALYPNAPNPFNPSTRIAYRIPEPGQVDLTIYNLLGQQVRVLVRDHRSTGRYEIPWDGRDGFGRYVSSGVYIYRLAHPGGTLTNRMLLIK